MPKAVLDVTAKDQTGTELFSRHKEFTVNDLYFKGGKQVPMAEWDITATEHFNLGVEPLHPHAFTYLIPLSIDTKSVDVEASFKYFYTRETVFDIKNISRKVVIEQ